MPITPDQLSDARWEARKDGFPIAITSPKPVRPKNGLPTLQFNRIGDVLRLGLKPISWLVRDYLESDALALLFGDPSAGKSFVAIDLACCIATGTPWHGHDVTQGAVFYIAGEGQNGLHRRFAAWAKHNAIDLSEAPLFVGDRPTQLCKDEEAGSIAHTIESMADTFGTRPALIVIDTVARNFGGADENSTQDMGAFIANIDGLLRSRDLGRPTVLLVHHSGHGDKSRARGSSSLKGALDAEYSLTKDDSDVIRLQATKMKDAPDPAPLAFMLQTVDLGADLAGEPISSAVLSSAAYVPPARSGKVGRGKNQTMALGALADLLAEHRQRLADAGLSPAGACIRLDDWRDRLAACGIDRKRFYEIRKTLEDAKLIRIEDGGHVRLVEEDCPF